MEKDNSRGQQLLEAMSRVKRIQYKSSFDEKIPRGEFMMMHVIYHSMKKQAKVNADHESPPGIKVSDLSDSLKISAPSVSQTVNALEDKGYVERIMTKNDRRVVYICLTDQGKSMLDEITEGFLTVMNEIVTRLGEEDTDSLIRLFNRLDQIIGDIRTENEMTP